MRSEDRRLKLLITLAAVFMIIFISAVDILTGSDYSLQPLYLIPLFLVCWFAGKAGGFIVAALCGTAWLFEEFVVKGVQPGLVSYWNLSASLILFFVIAYLAPELKDALRREKELVATDALTGVANRHTFYKLAAAEMGRLRRYKRPFTVIYIDIDNLKMVNYRHGHNAGDNILEIVAKTIKGNIREVDAVARFGGDEFAVLLPETASEQAQVVSSRLRSRLLDAVEKAEKAVSFSMGVVTFTTPPESVEDMMKKATVLMYAAKNSGTNMIEQDVFGGEGSA